MRGRSTDAAGFSLVEVVVAMLILALIALALLPVLVGATNTSVLNRSLVAATTLANAQIAVVRALFTGDPSIEASCADLLLLEGSVEDPAVPATGLVADIDVGTCPGADEEFPQSISVTITVFDEDAPAKTLAELSTRVLVTSP